jgi:hypothetical protein
MDPKYTNINKNYWHTYLNDKLIGMNIIKAIKILHQHKFSYFYRYHNGENVVSFDPSEIGKKFKSMCTIDTITKEGGKDKVISYINVPSESGVYRRFPI